VVAVDDSEVEVLGIVVVVVECAIVVVGAMVVVAG
jgi:hypothetical protein